MKNLLIHLSILYRAYQVSTISNFDIVCKQEREPKQNKVIKVSPPKLRIKQPKIALNYTSRPPKLHEIVVNSHIEYILAVSSWRRHLQKTSHDDVIKWKLFPRYWPFVWGIHRSPVNVPHKGPITQSFHVVFDLRLNKRLSKQLRRRCFGMPYRLLWRQCNERYRLWWHVSKCIVPHTKWWNPLTTYSVSIITLCKNTPTTITYIL